MAISVIYGNKREVPPGLPEGEWWHLVEAWGRLPLHNFEVPYYPSMEYRSPKDLQRIRAKIRVWHFATGEYPSDLSCWWEMRQGRKHQEIPPTDEIADYSFDKDGVLHCGKCNARWSGFEEPRCGLCGVGWILAEEI